MTAPDTEWPQHAPCLRIEIRECPQNPTFEMEIDIGYLVKMTIEDTLVWPGSGQLSRIEGNVYTPSGMPSSYFSFDRTLNYEVMVCQIDGLLHAQVLS